MKFPLVLWVNHETRSYKHICIESKYPPSNASIISHVNIFTFIDKQKNIEMLKIKRYFGKKSNVELNIYFEDYMESVSKGSCR